MTVLLPTTVGGHLVELHLIAQRAGLDAEPLWMTWCNAQTASVLEGERVIWVSPVHPRDWRGVIRTGRETWRILRRHRVTAVVTTGSGIALGVIPIAAAHGIPCHFIESAAHVSGAGLTGRVLQHFPGVHLYTQYPQRATGRWMYRGSVFEGFRALPAQACGEPTPIRNVVVTLGTTRLYSFRRLLERLVTILPADADVLWQTGCTDVTGLPIRARTEVPAPELAAAIARADLVIGHCGVGTALASLDAGRLPVLVPREAAHGECVDDHQHQLARDLCRLGVAITATVDDLDAHILHAAACSRVERIGTAPPFRLQQSSRPGRAGRELTRKRFWRAHP
ncbi:glycosyltransferase [Mycobacterium aquaticum]|uniref:Glycosyl transferase family 28 C-terminal domain-containing protein n=1 Tax=Mycobacterium aquaticum TaxID=1927124 RepID=A0A1X0AAV4_9MYCO|nr:glycosyltransferase [Mycobacterium aquaticum]ORA26988.1 hypothetical protein BST13_31080 [Mycobacterium aquaticum]